MKHTKRIFRKKQNPHNGLIILCVAILISVIIFFANQHNFFDEMVNICRLDQIDTMAHKTADTVASQTSSR